MTQAAVPPPHLALTGANPSPPGQPQEQTPVDDPYPYFFASEPYGCAIIASLRMYHLDSPANVIGQTKEQGCADTGGWWEVTVLKAHPSSLQLQLQVHLVVMTVKQFKS